MCMYHVSVLFCDNADLAAWSLLQEVENFAKAGGLDTHKALVHMFFSQRLTKKVKGVTDAGLKPRPVKKLAVLGGGLMGSGICTAALAAGIEVTLKEINEKFLQVQLTHKAELLYDIVKNVGKLISNKFNIGMIMWVDASWILPSSLKGAGRAR